MTGVKVTHLKRGDLLFSKGQSAKVMYFVLSGSVQIIEENNTDALSTGAIIGAIEFLNNRRFHYSARCASDVMLLVLDEKLMIELFRKQSQIGYNILKAVAAEIPPNGQELDIDTNTEAAAPVQAVTEDIPVTLRQLLPEGHPTFDLRVSAAHDHYIFAKDIMCPICDTSFSGIRIRESRLLTKEVMNDSRIIYEDFEPLWYYILVCPNCLFAYPHKQFAKLSHSFKEKVRKAKVNDPIQGVFKFSPQRTLNEVILSYYLALHTYEQFKVPAQQLGNLWLRLVWLYEDGDCSEWAKWAAERALAYFEETVVSSWRSEAGYQEIYVIMAELCIRLGLNEDALRHLLEAVNMRQGNERYRRIASDRIHDLRRQDDQIDGK